MSVEKMGLRAYARHRKEKGLTGQGHSAVRKAIDRGTLKRSVSYDGRGRAMIDAELADEEWKEGTDPAQQRDPEVAAGRFTPEEAEGAPADRADQGALFPELSVRVPTGDAGENGKDDETGPSIRQSQKVRLAFQARLAALEYEQKAGNLCAKDAVREEGFRLGRVLRDRILNVPDRIMGQVAAETDAHVCRDVMLRELNGALQELVDAERRRA